MHDKMTCKSAFQSGVLICGFFTLLIAFAGLLQVYHSINLPVLIYTPGLRSDEFPRRLCDTLLPVILFNYHVSLQPSNGNIKQLSQGVGGHRVYVGIRHPGLREVHVL